MYTAPNQKIVKIHKHPYSYNYLTIGIDEWQEAFKSLKRITFGVYLYLASNADGYELALSRQDVMNNLDISKNAYIRAIKELEEKGYLVQKEALIWYFYTTPREIEDTQKQNENDFGGFNMNLPTDENVGGMYPCSGTPCTRGRVQHVPVEGYDMYPCSGTETDKQDNKYNTDNIGSDEPLTLADASGVADATTNNTTTVEKEINTVNTTEPKKSITYVDEVSFAETLDERDNFESTVSFFLDSDAPTYRRQKELHNYLVETYGVDVKDIDCFISSLELFYGGSE